MRRVLLILAFSLLNLLLAALQASADERDFANTSVKPSASLVIDKAEIDAGQVLRGRPAKYTFVLKNNGPKAITIDAKPKCGCTIAQFDKNIPPGGVGKVEAELRTSSLRVRVNKTIQVTSTDPEALSLSLSMKAEIISVVDVQPPSGTVLPLKLDEPTKLELHASIRGSEPIEISLVKTNTEWSHAQFERVHDAMSSRPGYRIQLTVDPAAPFGKSDVTLTLISNSASDPTTLVHVSCEKGIVASPSLIFFGAIKPIMEKPVERIINLRSANGPIHVLKVESIDPNIEVKQDVNGEGNSWRLRAMCKGVGDATETQRGKILVHTDDVHQPIVEIRTSYVISRSRSARVTRVNGTPQKDDAKARSAASPGC